jgi:molybdenum cofactor cytidylyltransferase
VLQTRAFTFHATIIAMKALSPPRLRVVILAAGYSSRLGQPKALARVRGISLLRRTLKLAADLRTGGAVIVVTPCNATRYRVESRALPAQLTGNSRRARGLSSSVQVGIARARYSAGVLLLPVDLPSLKRRELAKLVSRWRCAPRQVVARRVAAVGGAYPARGGTPLILPRGLYRLALGIDGDVGLRDLIAALPASRRVLIDLPSAAADVDTPRDLQAARAYRHHGG